ncbi:MAG: hypothetical protein EOM12_05475 [Verrucomicrobiae bacterium]|nr:hypothetical protein [Verrucomicrobiae bacterium]
MKKLILFLKMFLVFGYFGIIAAFLLPIAAFCFCASAAAEADYFNPAGHLIFYLFDWIGIKPVECDPTPVVEVWLLYGIIFGCGIYCLCYLLGFIFSTLKNGNNRFESYLCYRMRSFNNFFIFSGEISLFLFCFYGLGLAIMNSIAAASLINSSTIIAPLVIPVLCLCLFVNQRRRKRDKSSPDKSLLSKQEEYGQKSFDLIDSRWLIWFCEKFTILIGGLVLFATSLVFTLFSVLFFIFYLREPILEAIGWL